MRFFKSSKKYAGVLGALGLISWMPLLLNTPLDSPPTEPTAPIRPSLFDIKTGKLSGTRHALDEIILREGHHSKEYDKQDKNMSPPKLLPKGNNEEENKYNYKTTSRQRYVRPELSDAAMDQWCPFAKKQCHNVGQSRTAQLCHPCTRRFLILIAMGRSASTTLQNMLHALPGIRMSGENNGMLTNFMYAVDATRRKNQFFIHGAQNRFGPWGHEPVPRATFACVTQQMVETMNPPPGLVVPQPPPPTILTTNDDDRKNTTNQSHTLIQRIEVVVDGVNITLEGESAAAAAAEHFDALGKKDDETIVGFKTIRFPAGVPSILTGGGGLKIARPSRTPPKAMQHILPPDRVDHVWEAAEFLLETFPCSRVIVNIRTNSTDYVASLQRSWNHPKKQESPPTQLVTSIIQQRNRDLQRLANILGPKRCKLLDSSSWTRNVTEINDLVIWLGYPPSCHFDHLFEYNTKDWYGKGHVTSRTNPKDCHKLPY